jgi:hypothetical protein
MVERWQKPLPDERLYWDKTAEAAPILTANNRPIPTPSQGEQLDQYSRRVDYEVQKCSPKFKDINMYDAKGDAYNVIKDQVYADAAKEARQPTQIEPGTLKEVMRYDKTGRPYSEFYGSPSAWMSMFEGEKKRLTSVKDNRKWNY